MLIEYAFADIEDEKKEYWKRRAYVAWNKRFESGIQCDWIRMMASFSDEQAIGTYIYEPKMQDTLILTRDEARKYLWITMPDEIQEEVLNAAA